MLKSAQSPDSGVTRLSPRGAVAVGACCVACGLYPVLIGLGVIHIPLDPGVARWVPIAAGAMFILAGCAVINGYAVMGGVQPNGAIPPDAPFSAQVAQYILGVSIIGLMFAIFAWVAFGAGERHFSSTVSMPGLAAGHRGSDRGGRIAFGVGAALIGLFFVVSVVSGARQLRSIKRRA